MIGSELYKLGGFTLPFYSVGAFATVMSFVLCAVVPNVNDDDKDAKDKEDQEKNPASFKSLLKVRSKISIRFLIVMETRKLFCLQKRRRALVLY